MKYEHLIAIKDWHTTGTLSGKAFNDVADLPVTQYRMPGEKKFHVKWVTASTWKLTVWQRVKFLFFGKLYVHVQGHTHAPIAVGIGEFFPEPKESKDD